MAPDVLGWRAKMGIVAPATNTVVQPEMEALRPDGVTNHHARIRIANVALGSDADFLRVLDLLDEGMDRAIDDVAEAEPDHLIIGVTSPMLRGGRAVCEARLAALEDRTKIAATAGSTALARVLTTLGVGRIGLVTPYQPVVDEMLAAFMADVGVSVARFVALRCPTPLAIARVAPSDLRVRIGRADLAEIEAWVQVGTNLPFTPLASPLGADLGKPVIGVNAASYWEALRRVGIREAMPALGPVLSDLAL